YDPASQTFTATSGRMTTVRSSPTATLLANGKVLIAGGNDGGLDLRTAELYDPASGMFTATSPMIGARIFHTATLLPDGKVLIAGADGRSPTRDTAELYDPANGTFTATSGHMTSTR